MIAWSTVIGSLETLTLRKHATDMIENLSCWWGRPMDSEDRLWTLDAPEGSWFDQLVFVDIFMYPPRKVMEDFSPLEELCEEMCECLNDGKCSISPGPPRKLECSCQPGYSGTFCEISQCDFCINVSTEYLSLLPAKVSWVNLVSKWGERVTDQAGIFCESWRMDKKLSL